LRVRDDLREQIRYYRARAKELDRVATAEQPPSAPTLPAVTAALRGLAPKDRVLELACGTGLWTKELLEIGQTVVALDSSPEVLQINRDRVVDPRVTYGLVDLFSWEPAGGYDLVFAAFWLSHVPPELMRSFLGKIARAVLPRGTFFAVDQYAELSDEPPSNRSGIYEERRTSDGAAYRIVKVFHDPDHIAQQLNRFGFDAQARRIDGSIFTLEAVWR
jgi:SAM-dependent methyltransferase